MFIIDNYYDFVLYFILNEDYVSYFMYNSLVNYNMLFVIVLIIFLVVHSTCDIVLLFMYDIHRLMVLLYVNI